MPVGADLYRDLMVGGRKRVLVKIVGE